MMMMIKFIIGKHQCSFTDDNYGNLWINRRSFTLVNQGKNEKNHVSKMNHKKINIFLNFFYSLSHLESHKYTNLHKILNTQKDTQLQI